MDSKKVAIILVSLFISAYSSYGNVHLDTLKPKKWQVGFNYHVLRLKYSSHALMKYQAAFQYSERKTLNVGMVVDLTRESLEPRGSKSGLRNAYFIGHQWAALYSKKRGLYAHLHTQVWYANGDIKSGGQFTADNYTATALIGIAELLLEKRWQHYFYAQAGLHAGIAYMYKSKTSHYQPNEGINITLGIMF